MPKILNASHIGDWKYNLCAYFLENIMNVHGNCVAVPRIIILCNKGLYVQRFILKIFVKKNILHSLFPLKSKIVVENKSN